MGTTPHRAAVLLGIIGLISRRHTPTTAEQIVQEFGGSRRNVIRFIDEIRCMGVPIQGSAGIGYILDAQSTIKWMTNLLFDNPHANKAKLIPNIFEARMNGWREDRVS